MVNSKQKGARFERQLAGHIRDYGYKARRGQQYCGANGDADFREYILRQNIVKR